VAKYTTRKMAQTFDAAGEEHEDAEIKEGSKESATV
jgi:hypothetical protein